MKRIAVTLTAAILAIGITMIQMHWIRQQSKENTTQYALFFTEDVSVSTIITPSSVEEKPIRSEHMLEGHATCVRQVVGLALTRTAYKGEPVLLQTLCEDEPEQNALLEGPNSDEVWISLQPDAKSAVAWQFVPGERIDLIHILPRTVGEAPAVAMHMSNIRVVALLDSDYRPIESPLLADERAQPTYVIVALSDEQAQKVAVAKTLGTIELVKKKDIQP